MKKVFTFACIAAAALMVSCGGGNAAKANATETEAAATEVVADSTKCAEGEECTKEVAEEAAPATEEVAAPVQE